MAILSDMMWIGMEELKPSDVAMIVRELTLVPKASPLDQFPPAKIKQYVEEPDRIGVPFAYGETRFAHLEIVEKFSYGQKYKPARLPDPNSPKSPPDQEFFFSGVLKALNELTTVFAIAPTGSGKTVTVLNASGTLGVSTLVVVPSAYLADQWREEAMRHLGLEWSDIGVLQGASADWKGKKIVIAIIHNLFLKEWPQEFYDNFGMVAWDEADTLGAKVFSTTMFMFTARYKIAVTATPHRKDGCDALYKNYFGNPAVTAKSKALACDCYVIPFKHVGEKHKWINKCKSDVKPMQWLSKLKMRNELIIKLACSLYDDGRNILIITKYIDHVELLVEMLVAQGIPREEIGQFTRETSEGKKHGKGFLEKIKKESNVIVGTYAMLKRGVDIPRLDTGIEALPSADAIQSIGRIRRPYLNKKRPKWFSISDLRVPLFEAYTNSRLRGFRSSNVTIKELNKDAV
jgi:superfamily II DNA or RNA helicase